MINGITFDLQNVMSADDAKLFWRIGYKENGVMSGCAVTESSGTLTVAAGYLTAYGRLSKIVGSESISAPTVTTGTIYCRLVYEIDLSQVNTLEQFNQGSIKILQSSGSYPSLTQENLDESGNVYQIPLAKFTVTSSGVSGLTDERDIIDYPTRPVSFDKLEMIWKNENPYDAFNAQTLSLVVEKVKYLLIMCAATNSNSDLSFSNFIVSTKGFPQGEAPEYPTVMSMCKLTASTLYKRSVSAYTGVPEDTKRLFVEFSTGYSGTTAGATYCIPLKIYAFR